MTLYPDGIDGYSTLPTVAGSTPEDTAINALRAAVMAIELELGLDPHSIYSDVATRLSILESRTGPGPGASLGSIDLNTQTSGVLDIVRGGTALNAPGALDTVLTSAGATLFYKLLDNTNIDAAAAIAGTKIAPNFGSQNIQTTGDIQIGANTQVDGYIRTLGYMQADGYIETAYITPLIGAFPATGFLRFPYNGGATVDQLIRVLDSGASEKTVIDYGTGNSLTFGNTSMYCNLEGYSFTGSFPNASSALTHAGMTFTPAGLGTPTLSLENSSLIKILATETQNVSTLDGYTSTKEEELKTTDSADHIMASFIIPDNSACIMDLEIIGIKADHTVMVWWKKSRAYLNDATTVTAGTQRDIDTEIVGTGTPTWTVALSAAAASSIDVIVNGQGDTVTWYIVRQALNIKPAI